MTASDGREGVAVFNQNDTTIDIIVLDLLMPVMDGEACAKALHDVNPGVKIIGMSGKRKDSMDSEFMEALAYFLEKPFTSEQLLAAVHAVL